MSLYFFFIYFVYNIKFLWSFIIFIPLLNIILFKTKVGREILLLLVLFIYLFFSNQLLILIFFLRARDQFLQILLFLHIEFQFHLHLSFPLESCRILSYSLKLLYFILFYFVLFYFINNNSNSLKVFRNLSLEIKCKIK